MGLFLHYIKLAFRNMWKVKGQTLISVTGLAVGFVCFSFATFWIVYEMTFDGFHKKSNHLYVAYRKTGGFFFEGQYSKDFNVSLASYLKETFPEIVNATSISLLNSPQDREITIDEMKIPASIIRTDASFFKMFDVRIIEGSTEFLISTEQKNAEESSVSVISDRNKIAITQEKARQLFGNEHPIGKIINGNEEICAIVSGMSQRSNYSFDFIRPFSNPNGNSNTIIELLPGINMDSFKEKLSKHNPHGVKDLLFTPITKVHYVITDNKSAITFQHILIFALCGLLIIISTLFNYLTLCVSRYNIRQKELGLRMVFGASGGSLHTMLSIEFVLISLCSIMLGWALIQSISGTFLNISKIKMSMSVIYRELLMYVVSIILIALLTFRFMLYFFHRRGVNESIRRSNKNVIRNISMIIQLAISIGVIFSVSIMLKQIYFLQQGGLGFMYKNRGVITRTTRNITFDGNVLVNQIKQLPEVVEAINAEMLVNLVPQWVMASTIIDSWDNKPADIGSVNIDYLYVSPEYLSFFNFQLVQGEMLTDADPFSTSVLLNESAVKAFGWHDPVGKTFEGKTVKGVIMDVQNKNLSKTVNPCYYYRQNPSEQPNIRDYSMVFFRYREGMWKTLKEKLERMTSNVDMSGLEIINYEEVFSNKFNSEKIFLKLLYFMLAVCVIICAFGLVALVSQTCAERRKSIAIHKINGAAVVDILAMFTKEYFLLLTISAAMAFSGGYFIMQRWLEKYIKQTSIPLWIYLSILFVMSLVIVLCVGWQVYRVSIENPAEVIKSKQ